MPIALLNKVRVLDATSGDASFCGLILSELGADVIKLEPPGGDPGRWQPPFRADHHDDQGRSSLVWSFLNQGKRGVILDPRDGDALKQLRRLLGAVDVFVDSFAQGYLASIDLDEATLEQDFPRLIHTSITPFGQAGPYAHLRATDLISLALAGCLHAAGDAETPPHRFSVDQAELIAAAEAAAGTLVALLARDRLGQGQLVDVAVHDTLVSIFSRGAIAGRQAAEARGGQPERPSALLARRSVFRSADGYVNFQILGGNNNHFVQRMADWMKEEGWENDATAFDWLQYQYGILDPRQLVAMEDQFQRFFSTRTTDELVSRSIERRLMLFPVNSPSRVLQLQPLQESGCFVEEQYGSGLVPSPIRFFSSSLLPWNPGPRAPALGEHTDEVLAALSTADVSDGALGRSANRDRAGERAQLGRGGGGGVERSRPSPANPSLGALSGVRVVDLSWVVAGPSVSRYLAACGADVIKIESEARPDTLRLTPPLLGGTRLDSSISFNQQNAGKKSVALDLRRPEARDLLLRLMAQADVVLENYTGGAMERMGFGYEQVRALRPEIVMLSLSSFGHGTSWATVPGYGMGLAATAGFTWLSGWHDGPPLSAGAYTDSIVPPVAAAVLIAALAYRNQTGHGQWIDLSQCAAAELYLAAPLLDMAANGREWTRIGNRSRTMAPHGVYPSGTPGRWCAIAVEDDGQWAAIKQVMGYPAWAEDRRLASVAGRLAAQDEIDALVGAWTSTREPVETVASLQAAGVPAAVVQAAGGLLDDPQLSDRGFFVPAVHPVLGETVSQRPGFTLSRTPVQFARGPLLGEHTAAVLGAMLGLSDDELTALMDEGVTR